MRVSTLGASREIAQSVSVVEGDAPRRSRERLIEAAAQAAHRPVEIQIVERRDVPARSALELAGHRNPVHRGGRLPPGVPVGAGLACRPMGRFIDVGQEATGFIAIGQFATGFLALGQVATGVIAIGQVARGFFVVGQAAFGLVAVGMGSGGLIYSVGMLGVGGRGLGGILPLVPRLTDPRELPEHGTFAELSVSARSQGWVRVTLESDGASFARLSERGVALPVRFDARLRRALLGHSGREVLASLRRADGAWLCDAVMEVPAARIREQRWWLIWAVQLGLLLATCVAFWFLAARPVLEALEQILF